MGLYNNRFNVEDFFMNPKLAAVFPQFDKKDLNKNILADDFIFNKVQSYLAKAINGVISEDSIIIEDEDSAEKLDALEAIAEGFFDNSKAIMQNLKTNAKLYTTVSNITQLAELKDETKKLKFFNEIQENFLYNPDFGGTAPLYKQRAWQNKVGYRSKDE